MRLSTAIYATLAALATTAAGAPFTNHTVADLSERDDWYNPVPVYREPCSYTDEEGLPRCRGYPRNQRYPMQCHAEKVTNGRKGKEAASWWEYEVKYGKTRSDQQTTVVC